ncbi:hypothetical protein [Chlorobaculum sp. 24CR]|uniref:hypothetical protein n=1 Tax=Chlorobaculum sp. 24CR TaxID=2508878 RepID=UPI001430131D|nr:hypothetical protein [Chlorobaculum sp. 24CR]
MSIVLVVQGKNLKIPVCHQTHNRLGEKTKAPRLVTASAWQHLLLEVQVIRFEA